MNKFFMDESGYTGFDLLNKPQPFQGASSLLIDELTAKSLVNQYFPNRKFLEMKHRSLSRRKNNWERLLGIQRSILSDYMGFTYVCDKKFLLILMFLDSCVEPYFHDRGVDFYQDGQNYALASLIYYTAPTFWGASNYDEILYLFQSAVKNKSDIAVQCLVEKAKTLLSRGLPESLMPLSIEDESCIETIKNPKTSTDAAFVVLISLISHIEKYTNNKYEIVHDTSTNLLKYGTLINKLVGLQVEKSFKQTAITKLKFPLQLTGVSHVDSRQSLGVQLADLLIGGMIEFSMATAGLVEKNDYNQSVIGLYGDTNIIHLLPSLNFVDNKNFRSGTEADSFIDFMARNIY